MWQPASLGAVNAEATSINPDAYYTTAEVSAVIRMSTEYVARQCAAGNLRATKLGTEWRIQGAAIHAFMGASEEPAPVSRLSARQRRRQP